MPRLPQDTDYGARPSLRVNRVDRPDTSGSELADSLITAANEFSTILKDRKAKEDALNYSLARNEIQQADLEARGELEGDTDWAGYDEKYTTSFGAKSQEILKRYNLSPHDLAIIGSESNLIKARGRTALGGVARGMEITEAKGRYLEGRDAARRSLESAHDFESRNAIIRGQLDSINAQEELGYFDKVEAQKERESVTQDFALASIGLMTDEQQIDILSDSLARRRGYGDNDEAETREQTDQRVREKRAAAGLPEYPEGVNPGDMGSPYQADFTGKTSEWGSYILKAQGRDPSGIGPVSAEDVMAGGGNVGDFLHADTASKMLKAALGRDKENRIRIEAQDAFDRAHEIYPEDGADNHKARLKLIADTLEGTARETAESNERQAYNDEIKMQAARSGELHDDLSLMMETEDLRYSEIDVDTLDEMSAAHRNALKTRSDNLTKGERWPAVTQYYDRDDGSMSMEEWLEMDDYGEGGKVSQNLETALFHNAFSQPDFVAIKAEQDLLKANEAKVLPATGSTPKQMVDNYLSRNNIMHTVERSDLDRGVAARLQSQLSQAINEKEKSLTPSRRLTEDEKNAAFAEVLKPMAFTDTDFFTSDYDPSEAKPVVLMNSDELNKAFVNIHKANMKKMMFRGQELNVQQILEKMGRDATPPIMPKQINSHDLRRAAFAFLNRIGDPSVPGSNELEVLRRLRGN